MLGCILSLFYLNTPAIFLIIVVFGLSSCCLGFCRGKTRALFVGLAYCYLHYSLFYQWHGEAVNPKETLTITASVLKISDTKPTFIELKLHQVANYSPPPWQTVKASLSYYQPLTGVKVGDTISTRVKLKPFTSRVNFAVYDTRQYAFLNHLHFKAFSREPLNVLSHSEKTPALWREKYRKYLQNALKPYQYGWLFYTLLSGQRAHTPDEQKTLIREAGLSHLLAISGLHIGLVYVCAFWFCKLILLLLQSIRVLPHGLFSQTLNLNKPIALVALGASAVFVWLCGAPVSALRALIMLSVVVGLYLYQQRYLSYRALLYALVGVLIFNPFSLLQAGLWFSFLAVGIIVITLMKTAHLPVVIRFVVLQLSLSVGLAPLSWFFFSGTSLLGVFANLVAIPLVSFLLLPVLLLLLPWLNTLLAKTLLTGLDALLNGLFQLVAAVPSTWRWLELGGLSLSWVLLGYLVLLALCYMRYLPRFSWAILAALLVAHFTISRTPPARWQVDVLDVGHGLAVVVSKNNRSVVYDVGRAFFGRYSIVRNTLLPFIQRHNLQVDHTIISHLDGDHAGGLDHWEQAGFAPTLAAFHPNRQLARCQISEINWQGLTISSLWPLQLSGKKLGSKNNANSCVVKISDGTTTLLLTGDITKRQEKQLLAHYPNLQADILISPHHGSKTSSSSEFVKQLNPKFVVHSSVARANWQLPHPNVVSRYQHQGAQQFMTHQMGGIRLTVTNKNIIPTTARAQRKYWFIE